MTPDIRSTNQESKIQNLKSKIFIVDAHLDLAYNALHNGRDLLIPVEELRQAEAAKPVEGGTAIVTFPELRKAGVGLVFGTIFAAPATSDFFNTGGPLVYKNADEAHRVGQEQLDYYHRLADEVDYIRLVGNQDDLDELLASHDGGQPSLVGIVPLMEGADPIRQPEEVELWYERGLRIIGLSWGDTRYSPGAWREGGGLTKDGWRLLETAADYNFILDLTHMSDEASLQVLDNYEGPIIASHSNARALVPTKRQLDDTQINRIAERNGVIGIAFANPFLKAGLSRTDPKESVTIEHILAHIDHICQNVGNADHVGIGTDFDGGFGVESIPAGMENPADFHLLTKALQEYGYDEDAITKIMGGNWLRLLGRAFDR